MHPEPENRSMTEASLKSELWIKSQIRTCDLNFLSAVVIRRGDSDAGAILLKMSRLSTGTEVYTQVRDPNGQRAWMCGTGKEPVSDSEASAFIEKQSKYDPDLWVLEIEDPKYKYTFDGKII